MLDLRGIVALQALQRQGTIVRAAQALGYTASAVSQQLATVERELGIALIDRGPRSATLNAAGREFVEVALPALDLLDSARARAAAAVGRLSGRVVVATIPSMASRVATALVDLREAEPLLAITLVQRSAPQAQRSLVERDVDVAVVDDWGTRTAILDPRLTSAPCFCEPVVLAGHPRVFAGRGENWESVLRSCVDDVALLSATEGSYSREFVDAFLSSHGFSPRLRWEFDGLDTLAQLVAQGHGVALLPRSVLQDPTREGAMVVPAPSTRSVGCLWLADAGPVGPNVGRCVDVLTTALVAN